MTKLYNSARNAHVWLLYSIQLFLATLLIACFFVSYTRLEAIKTSFREIKNYQSVENLHHRYEEISDSEIRLQEPKNSQNIQTLNQQYEELPDSETIFEEVKNSQNVHDLNDQYEEFSDSEIRHRRIKRQDDEEIEPIDVTGKAETDTTSGPTPPSTPAEEQTTQSATRTTSDAKVPPDALLDKCLSVHEYCTDEAGLERGKQGNLGKRGPPGFPGRKGDAGEKGERGTPGAVGPTGNPGKNGEDGKIYN